jgi:hypothetical protein
VLLKNGLKLNEGQIQIEKTFNLKNYTKSIVRDRNRKTRTLLSLFLIEAMFEPFTRPTGVRAGKLVD